MAAELIAKLTLDTYRENKIPPLVIPQRDYKARVVEVRLTTQGRPVLADATAAASITAKRLSDGSEKTFAGEMNENGTCTVPITQWMLDLEGTVHCTVSVTGLDYQYSANKFDLYVKYRPDATELSPDDPQKDLITEVIAGEAGRVAAENEREAAEAIREKQEAERVQAEDVRAEAFAGEVQERAEEFAKEQTDRAEAFSEEEEERKAAFEQAESERASAETARKASEEARNSAETARQAAEQTRKDAEAARVAAETVRAEEFATWGDIIAGVEQYESRISRNDKRITNLEQGLMADAFETDASVAYVKDVPANALPYAAVAKVGGMTMKCTNLLKSVNGYNNVTVENGVVKQNVADTRAEIVVKMAVYSGSTFIDRIWVSSIATTGVIAIQFQKTNDFTSIVFGIEGSERDSTVNADVSHLVDGENYTLSLNLTNITQGSISWCDMMLNSGSAALPYEPYFEGLRSSPVTEIESVGVNLCSGMSAFNPSVSVSDGVATQIINDTKPTFEFALQAYNKYGHVKNIIIATPLGTVGRYSWNFVKDNSFDALVFGHNGLTTDIKCIADAKHLINGETYTFSFELTNATQGSFSWKDVQINKGSTALPYTPYVKNTLSIPEAVQALDGYGWGVNDTFYNYIDWEKKQFVKCVGEKVLNGTEDWIEYNSNMATNALDGIGKYTSQMLSSGAYNMEIISGVFAAVAITSGAFTADEWVAYLAQNPMTVKYVMDTPEITDISDILSEDNFIKVEGGGTITFKNEYGYDVPTEIIYQLKGVAE